MTTITHNEQTQRFEIQKDGHTAYLSYQPQGDTLVYDHTIVPEALGGQGLAKQLTQHALDYAREQGKKVVPACSFVASFIQKNPDYADLVA
ncbi:MULTISPECIES: GNAT family N-acetyltransferase [unclassified Moraxella]|uniref:GNAT family N-acetyltransferase n=1 Tax=unclassified Moraxella TaxID=2685852 RepID=UPI003AF53EE8